MNADAPVGREAADVQQPEPGRSFMTLRVYRATRDGVVVEERGTVRIVAGEVLPPLMSHAYPPCGCPRHRGHS
ncbi:hypothetical protein [Streptomyces sp. bgisy100]|uniref:hypothetical protein n=1 Tax=Streptomyces sp. bgisy100 TaxID=3413783 RepID=UPI003D723AAD